MHSGKCLEEIVNDYKCDEKLQIDVPYRKFKILLDKVICCPSHALQILESK
jgi:hypothetical protein